MTVELILIEWNSWNGFIFKFIAVETLRFESAFFGINICRNFCYVDLFYKSIKVYDKFREPPNEEVL
jgi:hypothetical protein